MLLLMIMLRWFMMVMMMILLIRMMSRCHLVISWLGSSIISAVVMQQALLYEVTVKKKRLFFPKLNQCSSFLFSKVPRTLNITVPVDWLSFHAHMEVKYKRNMGVEPKKYALQTIAHKKMKNSAISGRSRPGLFRSSGTQLSAWICRKGGRLSKYFENFQPSGENFREKMLI